MGRDSTQISITWATGGSASETCPFAFAWNVTGWRGSSKRLLRDQGELTPGGVRT
ncbi:MAG TPA: hypothetical protein VHZ54_05690 [Solirubrobacterales bacterium]|nr:hypothetical protein [Solirubrobacterales bacterium]